MAVISDPDIPSFSVVDYIVFSLVLAVSICIGLYHAFTGGKQKTTKEIFIADRKMNSIPVGFSLLASWISAIALLGTPAECYAYGTMFWMICGSYIFMTLISAHLFIPTFYRLGITSVYEYLEMRFSTPVRLIGSVAFILYMVLYMSVVLYAPSLAISAVTGLNIWGAMLTVGLVCTLYTTLGGMKAVIWTDVFQTVVMFTGILAVIIHGSIKLNGFGNVWKINEQGGRIEFDEFSFNPTVRHTFWGLVIGGTFTWVGNYGCNQASVQRYLSCQSEKQAQISLYINMILLFIVLSLLMMCGLVIYAVYADCDPVSAGYISSSDQLMPFYVMKELGFIMGLPGLFVAATFSGALSTVSSGLNALAAVTMEDVIRPVYKQLPESKAALISKVLACVYGIVALGFAYLASQLGPVLQVAISLLGLIGGPLTGLFSLGLFFPWANKWGAIVGSLCGFASTLWIGFGAFVYPPGSERLAVTTDGCPMTNETYTESYSVDTVTSLFLSTTTEVPAESDPYPSIAALYSLSYMWYSMVGMLVVIIVGLLVSFLTGATRPHEVDSRLLCPVIAKVFCCCPGRCSRIKYCGVQYDKDYPEKDENGDAYGALPTGENGRKDTVL